MTDATPITDYNSWVEALRARKAELGLSDSELDHRAFLAAGHTSKVLGPSRVRGIGASVFDSYMAALAFDLVMVPNPGKLANVASSALAKRNECHVRKNHRVGKMAISRVMKELSRKSVAMLSHGAHARFGRKGGKARAKLLTQDQRSKIARKAARARWGNRRRDSSTSQVAA
jgi:hypothetical protein